VTKSCPLCSSNEYTILTEKVRFDKTAHVLKCKNCSFIYLDQSSFSLPDDFYEGEYHQTYLTHVEPSAFNPEAYYEKMVIATKPWVERISQLLTGREVILDYGCSTGHLLTQIQKKTSRVYGHELNRKEVEFCKNELGLDVSDKPLEGRFKEGIFDYITMIFVLEHIADPAGLLLSLKKFLKPGGKFIILVPNIKDALVSFYHIPEYVQFYFCVEHLYYYTPETIAHVFRMAEIEGSIETVQEYPVTNHLNWGYRKKPLDVLASRRIIPDIPLANPDLINEWEAFWKDVDFSYKKFLKKMGFGDRIWCVVG
jgi:2-polyprenyl-3-methyl-5-hydroxy-6-metoxy-1,4-benzoquinol methylase